MAKATDTQKLARALEEGSHSLKAIAHTALILWDEVETGQDRTESLSALYWVLSELKLATKANGEIVGRASLAIAKLDPTSQRGAEAHTH